MSPTRREVLTAGTVLTSVAAGGISAVCELASITPASAKMAASAADPESRLVHQRAIEAVLWSMPAISDVFFRESLFRDFGMKPGDVMVMSKPLVARHEVLMPIKRASLFDCRKNIAEEIDSGHRYDG